MPSLDVPIKRLFQLRAGDWIRFLEPECVDEWIKPFKTEYSPKLSSRLDSVFEVAAPEGTHLVNLEPMAYYDRALPARMMRYRSDIWEATITNKKGTPHILQVVIYFFPEHDHKKHLLTDKMGETTTVHFTYKVIRLWEISWREVVEQKLIGLYPLLPLMSEEQGESAKEVLVKSIVEISRVEDSVLQKDLLAVLAIVSGRKHSADFVKTLIRREMLMESPIYQEWIKEEVAEAEARGEARGETKGEIKYAKKVLHEYLFKKFKFKSAELQEKAKQISTLDILDSVISEIYSVSTLEEARAVINDGIECEIQLLTSRKS